MNHRTSIRVSKEAINSPELMWLYLLKSRFEHGVVFNPTNRRLSELTGYSRNTVSRYVNKLLKSGHVWYGNKGHLYLKPDKDKLSRKKFVNIDVRPWTTDNQFKNRVYAAFLGKHLGNQLWCGRFHASVSHRIKKGHHIGTKTLKKFYKRFSVGEKHSKTVYMSVRLLSRLFKVTKSKAQSILEGLEKIGYIKRKQKIETISNSSRYIDFYKNEMKKEYLFAYNDKIYVHRGQSIRFLSEKWQKKPIFSLKPLKSANVGLRELRNASSSKISSSNINTIYNNIEVVNVL